MSSTKSPIPANGSQTGVLWRTDLLRWRQLVSVHWLRGLLVGDPVHGAPAGHWRMFEVGEGPRQKGQTQTISGAIWLDVQQLEGGPFWNKVADDVLLQRLAALGIRHDTTVVLAGRKLIANARVAQLLLYAGVGDVRLLDGGTAAWVQAGLPLPLAFAQPPAPVADFGLAQSACAHYLVNTAQVQGLLHRPDATLVSIRTWSEFVGRTSGYDYIATRGEIAGARWGHAGADGDVDDMGAFHTSNGLMSGAARISALWRSQGIESHRRIVFYCGTGWRASLAFFYAWLMGWDDISVYDGGWLEWSSNPGNPIIDRQQAPAPLSGLSCRPVCRAECL